MSTPRRRKAPSRQPTRPAARRRPATGADFWGTEAADDDIPEAIAAPDDPAAMVRSLGPPPIRGHETAGSVFFVFEEFLRPPRSTISMPSIRRPPRSRSHSPLRVGC